MIANRFHKMILKGFLNATYRSLHLSENHHLNLRRIAICEGIVATTKKPLFPGWWCSWDHVCVVGFSVLMFPRVPGSSTPVDLEGVVGEASACPWNYNTSRWSRGHVPWRWASPEGHRKRRSVPSFLFPDAWVLWTQLNLKFWPALWPSEFLVSLFPSLPCLMVVSAELRPRLQNFCPQLNVFIWQLNT